MPITGLKANNFSSDSGDLTAIRNLLGLGSANSPTFAGGTFTSDLRTVNGINSGPAANDIRMQASTGGFAMGSLGVIASAPNAGYGWLGDLFNVADVRFRRGGTAQWRIEANSGLAVRNLANSADAPLTCGNLTASGTISGSQSVSAVSVMTCGNVAALHNSGWARPRGIGIAMGWNGGLFFTDTLDIFGAIRAMISSPSADLIEINNGVLGTLRDLSLRSITGTGNLTFASLPTSDPGVPGRIWRSGSDLKVSV